MVYCSSCGTANRDGSSFCNDCGAKLPSGTSVRCAQCGTPNSPSDTFCKKCGTRLVPTLADDTPELEPPAVPMKKGLSLPTKPDPEASSTPADWLEQLRSPVDQSAAEEPASPKETLITLATSTETESAAGDVPDWLTSLGIITPTDSQPASADEDVPEWLSQLPLTATESVEESKSADASTESPADWLSSLRAASDTAASGTSESASIEDDIPEWLRSLGTGPLPSSSGERSATSADALHTVRPSIPPTDASDNEEDVPEWLRLLGTGPLPSSPADQAPASADKIAQRSSVPSTDTSATEEEIPEWLRTLGTGPLPVATVEPMPSSPAAPIESKPQSDKPAAANPSSDQSIAPEELPDWLRNLGAADHTKRSTDELPDWLDSLSTEAAPEPGIAKADTSDDDDVPAWLRDLGASAVTQPVEPPSEAESSADDTLDWMSSLRATVSQPEEATAPVNESTTDEVPDWLQAMGLPVPDKQAVVPKAEETSDWMSSLRATASQPEETVEPVSEPAADEVPDWLQAMGLPASESATTPKTETTSDWMSSLRASASQPEETVESVSEPAADEVPDWLQAMGLPASDSATTPKTEATSDWMSSLRATASQPEETVEPVSESTVTEAQDSLQAMGLPASAPVTAPASDETSDWMSSLRATASQPEETAEPVSEPAADEVPDWLQAMGLPASDSATKPEAEATSDWMSSLRATAAPPEESAGPTVNEAATDEVPDWLRDFGVAVPQPAVSSEQPAEDVPDWLRNFEAPASQTPEPAPAAEQPQAEDVPDWLRDTHTADTVTTGESAAEAPAPTESIEPTAELPEWLSNLRTPAAAESAEPESTDVTPATVATDRIQHMDQPAEQDLLPAELPDWLKSLREGKPPATTPAVELLPGLMQAEIPSWLEALRPKEGQTSAITDLPAESEEEGVFAGLANVLPALPELSVIPATTVKEITGPSADDLARAGIFQELLTRPISRPTPVAALPISGKQVQRRWLQWAIVLLMAAAVVPPFLDITQGLPFLPHADNLPPSALVQSAVTKIAVLPPNASVLVVFDYDPTQAGEMDQIAEMVLRHLQTRAANITTVSLNPLGADLAQSLWHTLGDSTGGQRKNLGYVPGQAIGVQNVLLNNGPFELVVDLSASADSVRWWVEQLTVSGFNMPLIAGVSASVESLALPYAQSGQISGLISGAAGAMMYAQQANLLPSLEEALQAKLVAEQTKQPPSPEVVLMLRNQYHLESQTLAHWLLAILIIIGLVSGLISRAGRRTAL